MAAAASAALRRLCGDGGWSYVGVWRPVIAAGEQVHLVWGDAHCERTMSGFEAMDLLLKEKVALRSAREGQVAPEPSSRAEERVSVLVNKLMPNQVVVVGEGLIGEAALSGKPSWIVHDHLNNTTSPIKSLRDINQQLWAGVQTIVVIPLLPFGVVQLGSTRVILEDQGLINYVRSLFGRICSETGFGHHRASPAASVLKSSVQNSFVPPGSHFHRTSRIAEGDTCNQQYLESPMTPSALQSAFHPTGQLLDDTSSLCWTSLKPPSLNQSAETNVLQPRTQYEHIDGRLSRNPSKGKDMENQLTIPYRDIRTNNSAMMYASEYKTSKSDKNQGHSSCMTPQEQHELSEYSGMHSVDGHPRNVSSVNKKFQNMSIMDISSMEIRKQGVNIQAVRGNSNEIIEDCPEPAKKDNSGNNIFGLEKVPVSSRHTEGSDLFDVLRLQREPREPEFLSEGFPLCGPGMADEEYRPTFGDLGDDFASGSFSYRSNPDQLLEAMVSKMSAGEENQNISFGCSTSVPWTNNPMHSSCQMSTPGSKSMLGNLISLASSGAVTMERSEKVGGPDSAFADCSTSMVNTAGSFQRHPGYKSQISLWVENSQSTTSDSLSAGSSKKGDEGGKPGRKRARAGEAPRPRPKDRQMIQDRIKELRELVPNGGKCSIDALLEKTIKHMLFLQSVAKHADKLKEAGEPKIISQEGGLLLKDNFEGGATWAFEVGTQSMTCPIIVEDLNPPRQMLVEMLCKERGIFLEIADQIRGMGLTILKGVMEVRKDKVWARFAVEANKDVTRMEIFLSLVHLLEPASESPMLQKGVENISLPQRACYSSSIPATGLSDYRR